MSLELYKQSEAGSQHHHYNTAVITKLLRNYRSHPAILKLPNDMFYDSELVPCANVVDREKLCKLDVTQSWCHVQMLWIGRSCVSRSYIENCYLRIRFFLQSLAGVQVGIKKFVH